MIEVLAGKECPKCHQYGLFKWLKFWQCEKCLTKWEYDPRIKIQK